MSGIKDMDALIRGCINPAYPKPDECRGTAVTVEFEPLYEAIETGLKIVHYESRENAIELEQIAGALLADARGTIIQMDIASSASSCVYSARRGC